MGSKKENNMNNDDRSNSSNKYGGQQNQNPGNKQSDLQTDWTKQGSGSNQPNKDKQAQKDAGNKKDVDSERHPEEQVVKPKEYKKEHQKFNDKSESL